MFRLSGCRGAAVPGSHELEEGEASGSLRMAPGGGAGIPAVHPEHGGAPGRSCML